MMHASRRALDAHRQHWQHGPIDLVIEAWGDAAALERAYASAWTRFENVLPELVSELVSLRSPVDTALCVRGPVAQRMLAACHPHAAQFITPMAAVAGAVADEVCALFAAEPGVRKAYVNNGGDIALHLRAGESLKVGVIPHPAPRSHQTPHLHSAADSHSHPQPAPQPLRPAGDVTITSTMTARGVATSGWRGRSFSLGIADSVTVLAANAAAADAAATMIANAVNAGHPAIVRAPANSIKDDTDLGSLLVTVEVPPLPRAVVRRALDAGVVAARALVEARLIDSALLLLQGETRQTGKQAEKQAGKQAEKQAGSALPGVSSAALKLAA